MYLCKRVCIAMRVYVCACMCVCVCLCVCMCMCVHVCACMCVHVCVCVCVCVCVHVCVWGVSLFKDYVSQHLRVVANTWAVFIRFLSANID